MCTATFNNVGMEETTRGGEGNGEMEETTRGGEGRGGEGKGRGRGRGWGIKIIHLSDQIKSSQIIHIPLQKKIENL